ncbi:carbohydrate-binding protein [Rugosimonospora acidiphila]|uniref:carbohydrate-binding protein n=1 Tax=Rugosimonospora acidiphila TaxID=556531 RepID=UPI0031E9CD72
MADHRLAKQHLALWLSFCLVLVGLASIATAAPARAATAAVYAQPSHADEPLNERFRGVNWERSGDNFTPGVLLQDGLTATDSYDTVYLKATQILTSLKSNLNINTVRLGLNEATVAGAWWTNYGAVVQAATDLDMNVVLSFWSPSNGSAGSAVPCTDGTFNGCYPVSDYAPWWAMWQKVIDTYAADGNVYLMPFNEAAGYSDTATGYEGPSATQLADLDAAWLTRYSDFPRGRVILGGTGDDYYLTLGKDHRLDGTLLSYHPYCSFGLNFPTEAAWTQWIKGQIAGMESRTVITEFGLGEGGTNFDGQRDGNNCVSYVYAVTDYARANHLGLIYWDYGSTDSWSVATRTGSGTTDDPYATHIRNQSFVDRLEWGYGLDRPLLPTVTSVANTSFYTGSSANSFTVRTTGDPAASLTATGAGDGGTLPAGVGLVDNGDGTATLSGDPASLVAGTYPITLKAQNSQGSSTQTLTLTVVAGAPPAPTTGVIAGRITDAAGHPLAAVCAHVFLASSLPTYRGNNYAPATYQACSASDGTYSIPLVNPGSARYNVQFIDQNATYLPSWYGDTSGPGTGALIGYNHPGTPITVTANTTTTVDATMQPIPSGITVSSTGKAAPPNTWSVSGTITVTNHNNVPLSGVTVTDSVNDPNAKCVVTGGTGATIAASPLYPGALVTADFPYTCTYSAPPATVSEVDTARATWDFNTNVPNDSYQYTQQFDTAPAWSASAVYDNGDLVSSQGAIYQASWWTQNQQPGDPNGPWQEMAVTSGGVPLWTPSRIFNTGDVAVYQGDTFRARWYTRNQQPGDPNGPWEQVAPQPPEGGPAAWTATTVYTAGDQISYSGHVYEAQWWTRNQAPGDPNGPWKLIS